jgi:alpha-1,6-mannosyltransferase
LPEVVGDAGVGVFGSGYGAGVAEILARPEQARRDRARARAEQFAWPAAVAGFLRVHGIEAPAVAAAGPVPLHMSATVPASMVEEVTR